MKKCRNCGRYPFCVDLEGPDGVCNNWIELEVKCKSCLGCNRLEDVNFRGTYRCEWNEKVSKH